MRPLSNRPGQARPRRRPHSRVNRRIPAFEALPTRQLLAVVVSAIDVVEGSPFSGQVALFDASDVSGPPDEATAAILWGDGTQSAGEIRPVEGQEDQFEVVASSKVYAQDGPYFLTVSLAPGASGGAASGTAKIQVAAAEFTTQSVVFTPTVAQPFTGVVARFFDSNPLETPDDFVVTVNWGDGSVDRGRIQKNARGEFEVIGTHTFATAGPATVTVDIAENGGGSAQVESQAVVVQPAITALGATLSTVAGQPFSSVVATFFDARPGATASDYRATIDWGDGFSSLGLVQQSGPGSFQVIGTHTYDAPAAERTVKTQIVRLSDGQTAAATGTAVVVNTSPFSVRLDPLSDTGASQSDGVTAVAIPTFVGTAEPFAVVSLIARQPGRLQEVDLGSTIADAAGNWRLTSIPLSDGHQIITGIELPPGKSPRTLVADYPDGQIVIDTVAPRISALNYDPATGSTTLTFVDDSSGFLNGASPSSSPGNASNFLVVGPSRSHSPALLNLAATRDIPNDPRIVTTSFRISPPVRTRSSRLMVLSGGVADIAGNALDGVFHGTYPTGNGRPGGVFVAPLIARRTIGFARTRR